MQTDRRQLLLAGSALAVGACAAAPNPLERREGEISPSGLDWTHLKWRRGIENQRRADLGDGRYLNPILAGDHPDPTIIRDGETWYMTFSSFDAYPGLVIWKSPDLVNWTPVTAALETNIGSVWAPELVKHNGRYFLYIPARFPDSRSIYVIHADRIEGPWNEPIDLKLPRHIDPGHAVGEDGKRYLFLSGGDRVALSDDGLSTIGDVTHVYDPWKYPDDWVVEGFAPEGPKVMRKGEWFYLITAVGGTAGPPTGHMVIAARSKSIHGPWQDAPNNPIVRTWSAREKWWSRGHATLVEGPSGRWFMVYHGYENGFWTLGRQTLLDPVEWTKDGWFKARGGDLSKPLTKPINIPNAPHGMALSDDFSTDRIGLQWAFHAPGPNEAARRVWSPGMLRLKASGKTPTDSRPLMFICGDQAYEVTADIEIDDNAEAGLLLWYSPKLYAGIGFNAKGLIMHRVATQRGPGATPDLGRRMQLRVINDRHIVTMYSRTPGKGWTQYGVRIEVSGYNHNTAWDFLSLRPAIYCSGQGEARLRGVTYRAL
ncbi:MAG TPA: family 43 glycosylhydrolase [Hyphomonadaceae bacterium]|jgi:beta-xylosidase|nr:family 43 glycosylhydrolase [Hyphomonadaceae bacterium]